MHAANMGYRCTFRRGKTIRSLLVVPKDKDPITKKSGVIYRYKCDRVEYDEEYIGESSRTFGEKFDEEYIGESSRTFGERFKEHLKAPFLYMTTLTSLVIPPQ